MVKEKCMQNMLVGILCPMLACCGISNASDAKMQSSEKTANAIDQKETQMKTENQIPQYLYKIVSPEEWQESIQRNQVVNSLIDNNFIHLATEGQIPHVAQKFWSGKTYIVLKLNSKKLTGRLVYEINPGGTTQYYHLYEGKIPLDAVIEVSKPNMPER